METEVELRARARWLFQQAEDMHATKQRLYLAVWDVEVLLANLRRDLQPDIWQGEAARQRSHELDERIKELHEISWIMQGKASRLANRAYLLEQQAYDALLQAELLSHLEGSPA